MSEPAVTTRGIGPVIVGEPGESLPPEWGTCSKCGERVRWSEGAEHIRSHRLADERRAPDDDELTEETTP